MCGKRNAIADAESKAAWKAHPNDEEAHFRAVCQARAARQPEEDLAGDGPNSCPYYKWRQETGAGDYLPNWVHYDGGSGGGNGRVDGGGGWGESSEGCGWAEQASEYGGGSSGSVDSDFNFGDDWG